MKKLTPLVITLAMLSILAGMCGCNQPTKPISQTIVLDKPSKDSLTKNGLAKGINTYFCENITVNNYNTDTDVKDILFYHNMIIGILIIVIILLVVVIYYKVILNINLKL